jgi:nitric oxide reductase subunit B
VCGTQRPGTQASYTQNWPYDPLAGNEPTPAALFWSVMGSLALMLAIGLVLYLNGRGIGAERRPARDVERLASTAVLDATSPTPTQRATYKFFAVAALLFLTQVLAGVLTVHDYVGFTTFFGHDIARELPVTVVRSWHVQLSVLWIATCWIAGSIYLLPVIARRDPPGQVAWVNLLFWLLVAVVAGTLVGTLLGPLGLLGEHWRTLGHQGWEFVELGKLWQVLLFVALALWSVILFRGLRPVLAAAQPFSLPAWVVYAGVAITLLFLSGFVAQPDTNFVVADFWRWMVIHMWAECFFEVFTTVIVAWFMVHMGLVGRAAATRVVFFAVLLFCGSGLLGISHNFYWNAKPEATLAIGSVFSTMQVVPLVLLTVEAWKLRNLPRDAERAANGNGGPRALFGQGDAFRFLLGVNFWNFVGAGAFGFIINLPIVNYFEHGTYLTVNHGHAALMGVYGNLSVGAILFCSRQLVRPETWNGALLKTVFWSLNAGLMLMVLLDLLPAGLFQLQATLDQGLWHSRSQAWLFEAPFQTLTWMRIVGGALFVLGGVVPLSWFLVSRWRSLRDVSGLRPGLAEIEAPIEVEVAPRRT